jgi:hypothetical protein
MGYLILEGRGRRGTRYATGDELVLHSVADPPRHRDAVEPAPLVLRGSLIRALGRLAYQPRTRYLRFGW